LASVCLAWLSTEQQHPEYFWFFMLFMLPVLVYFLHWLLLVWKDEAKANFKNSFQMNIIASACTIFYFLMINAFKYFE
jgi:1,4-dihydroxy-2-naphthoate octaprenyltransferase